MWRRNQADQQTLRADIRRWFTTPVGERHLAIQQRVLAQLLPGYFGYHLLQLSPQSRCLYDQSPVGNQMSMGNSLEEENASFWGDGLQLPFENDSIDVLILHHMLDFFEEPQQLLREVERVALPMGYLVILGFNPVSTWGLWREIAKISHFSLK
ncbi:MAG: methyltransferase domain-containing protein, partial [Pseudomonadota bacterium]